MIVPLEFINSVLGPETGPVTLTAEESERCAQ